MSDTTFTIRVDDGPEQEFTYHDGRYVVAAMAAFGALKLPYPCEIEMWIPSLLEHGYGPYHFRLDYFVDNRGNEYGCPSVLSVFKRPAKSEVEG